MGIANQDRWVWMDLEMTGLDPQDDVIIQIATVITDSTFEEKASLDLVVWQPDSVLERMGPFVRKMHTDNGLLERVRRSDLDLRGAEQKTLEMITAHCGYRRGILAGNSIYQDRRFLTRYMPSLESYLHYRQIDVSSFKVCFQAWHGDKGAAPKTQSSHTALEDIRQSIAELRWYQQHCKV
jgi:oligoribonuclease